MNARGFLGILLAALLLAGCTAPVLVSPSEQSPTLFPGLPVSASPRLRVSASPLPSATATASPPPLPLDAAFRDLTSAFVLYDENTGQTLHYHPERCAEGLLPASTFKILNALIGLETRMIPDENYTIPWDGHQYPVAAWNQDHTLKTAMQNSVVWYYQELARRVGREKMQQYVSAAGYGNQDISGNLDSFWLDGGLRISADEQVDFLRRLYHDDLPFSARSMRIVREMLLLETTEVYRLSGKTGSTQMGSTNIGWFVGYVETQGDVYFFATNIAGPGEDAQAATARDISRVVLQELGVLP
jgi:beta-lactamase class D